MQLIEEFNNTESVPPPGFVEILGGALVSPRRMFERVRMAPPTAAAVGFLVLYLAFTEGAWFLASVRMMPSAREYSALPFDVASLLFKFGLAICVYYLFASILYGEAVSVTGMFTVYTFSNTPVLLVTSILLALRVLLHVEIPDDAFAPLSYFFKPENHALSFIITQSNLLNTWGLIVLFLGLRGALELSPGKALRTVIYAHITYTCLLLTGMAAFSFLFNR